MEIDKEKWDEKEVNKAAKIILDAKNKKSHAVKIIDEIIHWGILFVIFIGNVLVSGFLVVASGLLNKALFYSLIVLFGLMFGIFFEIPIKDIQKIDKNKHFIVRVLMPLLALINIYVFIGLKKIIENQIMDILPNNPIIYGLVYGICFLIPWLGISLFRK